MSARLRGLLLWTAAVLGLVNLVVFLAYTAPRAARKRDVAARTATLETELVRQRTQLEELRERAETIAANRKDARAFMDGQVAPAGALVVPFMREVEALARKQGLRVGQQTFPREAVKGLPVERFGVVMPVTGTYQQVTGFVGELEASPTFVTLDKISARTSEAASGAQVGLDMEFAVYYRTGAGQGPAR